MYYFFINFFYWLVHLLIVKDYLFVFNKVFPFSMPQLYSSVFLLAFSVTGTSGLFSFANHLASKERSPTHEESLSRKCLIGK